jgi:hypothetical protein
LSLTLNWYLDRRDTSPTFVCISPNRIPGKNKRFLDILTFFSKEQIHVNSF